MTPTQVVPDRTRTSSFSRSRTNPLGVGAASYKKLVTEIACLYEGARKALVEAYWAIGKRIVEVEQQGAVKAAYGAGLLQKLSRDLSQQIGRSFSESHLRRMRQFYLIYPKRAAPHELTWTQYAELLPVGNASVRERLVKRALDEGLSHKALRELVKQETVREEIAERLAAAPDERTGPPELLTAPELGPFYTYKIIAPETADGRLLIDLGFSCNRYLDAVTSKIFKPGDIVTSTKAPKGRYSLAPYGVQGTANDALFVYRAKLEKIVDGDTLRVVVDLGFDTTTRQYIRLRAIDCPEMDTKEGVAAKKFVETLLKGVEYLTIKTVRSDKYDRYLGDVFLRNKDGAYLYLNNELIEKGMAVRVRG